MISVSIKILAIPVDRPWTIILQTLSVLVSCFPYMNLKQHHQVSDEKFSSEYVLKQALKAATVELLQFFSDNSRNI